ncbi:MAG TPA: cysteine hydrolase family protein [Coleofasciculaceae cyanobacterium]
MQALSPNTALVVIDVQQGFDDPIWGKRNNPDAEGNIAQLLQFWRDRNRPVIHVQHLSVLPNSPLRPNQAGCEFKHEAQPLSHEPIFQKTVNSAFIGTSLEFYLKQKQIETLVIAGLTTDHCVSTSTRMAANLGFEVLLVSNGTATFDRVSYNGKHYTAEEIHESALASLHHEFATVVDVSEVIARSK